MFSNNKHPRDVYDECFKTAKKECTNVKIFDTICNATCRRQEEAKEISRIADAIIVIGGKSSANSLKLAEICRANCGRVYFVESADELDISDFSESDSVGITAGASTPAWIIKEVYQMLTEEMNTEETSGQEETKESETGAPVAQEAVESFEEMLERSIKTLNTGEKVTGIVGVITPTEISVDLGTKQSGYIPIAELSDDPTVKAEDIVKVGDLIDAFVLRVNDVEGTVMLSKKRLDSIKNWDEIEKAKDEKATVEGVVTEENKRRRRLRKRNPRFCACFTERLSKESPMSLLLKTKVKLRILKSTNPEGCCRFYPRRCP